MEEDERRWSKNLKMGDISVGDDVGSTSIAIILLTGSIS